jgi:hypothetical protein
VWPGGIDGAAGDCYGERPRIANQDERTRFLTDARTERALRSYSPRDEAVPLHRDGAREEQDLLLRLEFSSRPSSTGHSGSREVLRGAPSTAWVTGCVGGRVDLRGAHRARLPDRPSTFYSARAPSARLVRDVDSDLLAGRYVRSQAGGLVSHFVHTGVRSSHLSTTRGAANRCAPHSDMAMHRIRRSPGAIARNRP